MNTVKFIKVLVDNFRLQVSPETEEIATHCGWNSPGW
jgi:hypothetical protein